MLEPPHGGPQGAGFDQPGVDALALRRARILYWIGTLSLPLSVGASIGYAVGSRVADGVSVLSAGACCALAAGLAAMTVALRRERALNGASVAKSRVLVVYACAFVAAAIVWLRAASGSGAG